MPAISVVIPSFNGGPWLARAVQSVREQDFTDWEIIIVDDGSTDGRSLQVARELVDARVLLVVHERNQGLAAARNTGIEHARGDIIVPLDADDRLPPGALEKIAGAFAKATGAEFAYGHVLEVSWETGETRLKRLQADLRIDQEGWIPWCGCSPFLKSLWARLGGYDASELMRHGAEEWSFWCRAEAADARGVFIDAPLYVYIRQPESMSQTLYPTLFDATLLTLRRLPATYLSRRLRKSRLSVVAMECANYWRQLGKPLKGLRVLSRMLARAPFDFRLWRAFAGCLAEALCPPLKRRQLRRTEHTRALMAEYYQRFGTAGRPVPDLSASETAPPLPAHSVSPRS